MTGANIGDLLNAKHVTWGWFQGGFKPTQMENGKAVCGSSMSNAGGQAIKSYTPHHEPFQYYASTANPHHLPPSNPAMIGRTDQANHQYDLSDFWTAADRADLPAVSFLKAPAAEGGHPQQSSPLDEQKFLVTTINRLVSLPAWSSTAVFLTWDESGGWYDHVAPPQVSPSNDTERDVHCGTAPPSAYPDRCGFGPRIPLLVLSPYAKANYVGHSIADLTSILRFIEDNWQVGRIGNQSFDARAGTLAGMFDFSQPRTDSTLQLDPNTGAPTGQ